MAVLRTPDPGLSDAAAAVASFYIAVEAHAWDAALALWSPSMQDRYPLDEFLVDRYTATQTVDIDRLRTLLLDLQAGRAQVSITLVDYRSDGTPPEAVVGTWDVVLADGRWLLDDPNFPT